VLVLEAGTGASNSLVRSLKADDAPCHVVGASDDRFALRKSTADRRYLLPPSGHADHADAVRRVVEAERVDLLMPHTDAAVRWAGELGTALGCRVFLPDKAIIELCQDKYALARFLRTRGVPTAATYPVTGLGAIPRLFHRLPGGPRRWCRIRTGAGSAGAIPVTSPDQARSWIRYWEEMRGVPATDFTLSEYLPGRDFACQSLWQDGRLVLIKTCERLAYFWGASRPSGVSGIAALAKTVVEPRVVEVSRRAIQALDPRVSGAFSVDLKANRVGVPCVTEINAGRFITMMSLFDLAGRHNMSRTYVRVALGDATAISDPYDAVEDYYFVRDVDTVPAIVHASELFDGFTDARA
jgi:carbamoyl-phosphate synthase large subunit